MNHEELLTDIKSRGYWRIEIHSADFQGNRLSSRATMEKLMSGATVSLRGWPYPYYPAEKIAYNGKWLEGQISWSYHKEYWRLYESGQWLHYLSLVGAWITREERFKNLTPPPPQHPGYLHVRGDVLFTLTEVLRFAVGLAQGGILDPAAFISIRLKNTYDYMLFESFSRFFPREYVNPSDRPIEQEWSLPVGELSALADQMALDMAIKIYSVFNWSPAEAAIRTLVEDQKKLVERRL